MRKLNLIVVFNEDLSKTLFCIRAKEPYKGLYNFVGGKVEENESNDEAAYRELFEETGISTRDIELDHFMDLNYFKYCFLRLAGAEFSEDRLETDFIDLIDRLAAVRTDSFMFRDFQSRNIMIREGEVWFIDYQGGRQGALSYDVASLLYDAIVEIPDNQREELLAYYIQQLKLYRPVDEDTFRNDYYHFVLIRLLQALGAFGLRGLYERKQHFLDSIQPGLRQVDALFDSGRLGGKYPEIRRVITSLRHRPEEEKG